MSSLIIPLFFRGLKKITSRTYVERTVIQAIKNDIAIFAIHTNLDNVYHQGVNARIAEAIGLIDTSLLVPKIGINDPGRLIGSGMIGYLPQSMSEMAFLQFLKETMKAGCIRYTHLRARKISKVAVCGGSGGFLLEHAIKQGADIFITADYKYHEFFDADGQIVIADIGHYESEQYTIELLSRILSQKFSNFAAHCTKGEHQSCKLPVKLSIISINFSFLTKAHSEQRFFKERNF